MLVVWHSDNVLGTSIKWQVYHLGM